MPSGSSWHRRRLHRRVEGTAAAGSEQEHQPGGLQRGERDRDVARVLGDLALADGALLLEFLQLRDDHAEDLHDDAGGDVGHDAQREDREALEAAAGEQVEEPRAPSWAPVLELLDRQRIDTRDADGDAESVERMISTVNRILLRRSWTLKMFLMFDSTGETFLAGFGWAGFGWAGFGWAGFARRAWGLAAG